MRRFFELFDDKSIPGRWHLGALRTQDGQEPGFDRAKAFTGDAPLVARLTREGAPLDFSVTTFAAPVVSGPLARTIAAVAGPDVQCVALRVPGHDEMSILNVLRVVQCLDERRSEFVKWTDRDHRADLAGQYRQVTRLLVAAENVPADAHVFRIEGWLVALIVSDTMKATMEAAGCSGATFTDVTALGPN